MPYSSRVKEAKSPDGESSSAFGTSKDKPKVTEVSQCHFLVFLGDRKEAVVVFLPLLYISLY